MTGRTDAAPEPAMPGNHRQAGRPRGAGTDEAILQAAIELLAETGLAGTTIGAVARRAGVARATVYLRWPTRDALLTAAARAALGEPTWPIVGDLPGELRIGGERARAALAQPLFVTIFPEIARALLAREPAIDYDEIAPNRRRIASLYRDQAAAAGFRTDVDPNLPFDVIIGTILNHVLATRRAPAQADVDRLVEVLLSGLRRAG